MKKPIWKATPRPDGLFDLHLFGANGEQLHHGMQGYERRNVRRALASIKKAAATAELVFEVKPPG